MLKYDQLPFSNHKYFKLLTFLALYLTVLTLTQNQIFKKIEKNTPQTGPTPSINKVLTHYSIQDLKVDNSFPLNLRILLGPTAICGVYRHCLQCFTAPDYDCTSCPKNFVLSAPFNTDDSCKCQSPLTIVSGVCDNHQFGCSIVMRLTDDSLECQQCDINKMLILNPTTKLCECRPYFEMDSNFECQEICGDGVMVRARCDDANTQSGDGCSSSCMLETGFDCDTTIQPTKCKSQSLLFYKVDRITKQPSSNKAVIRLILPLQSRYPFPVFKQQLGPISDYISFKIILSTDPYTEIVIENLEIVQIDEENSLSLLFNFNQNIEGAKGKLVLNYQNTRYTNYIQNLQFSLVGDNAALIYEAQIDSYKSIGYGILASSIINSLLLFIGFISPKFIGLEPILTLQLIFFSQTLIYDHTKFPIGFLFLENLLYSTGYNDIFDFTDYFSSTQNTKKMTYIKRYKTIIENFNVNFVLLFFAFTTLLIVSFIRTRKQKIALQQKDSKIEEQKKAENQEKLLKKKKNDDPNVVLRKFNDVIFYVCNQIAFWMFLPLVSAIAAEAMIENQNLITNRSNLDGYIVQKAGEVIAVPSLLMIFGIAMSNFGNTWQSTESIRNASQRPQEIYYKRWLFVYLWVMGFLVLFLNQLNFMKIYASVIVMLIQLIHIIVIFYINPYKMSLKVHTVGMLINSLLYLAFIVIINFINYMEKMQPSIAMLFGYVMLASCAISIIITVIRLYYELRYGRELEIQLEEQRLQREQEENLRKQALQKNKMQQMQNAARMKMSEKQQIRQKNIYLNENQILEDQKNQLLNWLDSRPIDKKTKQAIYYQKFTQKPLQWLRQHDPGKYELKISEINQHLHNSQLKIIQKMQNQKYLELTTQLRKQTRTIKKVQEERVRMHEKMMKTCPNYSMNIHKLGQEKTVHPSYILKD